MLKSMNNNHLCINSVLIITFFVYDYINKDNLHETSIHESISQIRITGELYATMHSLDQMVSKRRVPVDHLHFI